MGAKILYPVVGGKKECGECNKTLPIKEFDKARNHYTSKCKSCRSKYAAEYRQIPSVKDKSKLYHQEYMKDEGNRKRANENSRRHMKLPESKLKKNINRRAWTANEKQKCIDFKGGKCVVCGYYKCQAALEFHHLDPSTKEGHAGGSLVPHWTFERNKEELSKCVLVCNRCHREIHAGVVTL